MERRAVNPDNIFKLHARIITKEKKTEKYTY